MKKSLEEDMEYIRNHLPYAELLAQLAEEASELAQAALKYRRVLDGTNPTPVEEQDAIEHLVEEAIDVYGCLIVASVDVSSMTPLLQGKYARWVKQLEER